MKPNPDSAETADPSVRGFRDNYLLFQLAFVSHFFSQEFHETLRSQGMSPPKWRILVNILERPGIRVTVLARNTLFEQSRVTKMTDQLCDEKLVVKKIDQSDRRKVNLFMTQKGKGIVLPLIEQARAHEAKLLSQLDPDDARQLKQILAKLVKPRLEEINRPG